VILSTHAYKAHCYGRAIGATLAELLGATTPFNTTGASTACTGYPDTCHALPPPPPAPGPIPHHAAYNVTGAGSASCNGVYANMPAPHGWEHSAYYVKDPQHQLYRYRDTTTGVDGWHICTVGVRCYYDAPTSSDGAPEPPDIGWLLSPNSTGIAPAPTLLPIQ